MLNMLIPLLVIIPLIGAAAALIFAKHHRVQAAITLLSLLAAATLGGILVFSVADSGTQVVALGGWDPPFGIVLVADRLSALLVTVSAIVLAAVLIFSIGQGVADGDNQAPVSIFYPSYLVLGAGVFDAFLAGDLFNLYVAFEILLVASYVLITMGATAQRIRAGVTYTVVSLLSSVLFLTAIALVYATCGTVNMAQLAVRIPELDGSLQLVLNIMLLVAFGIKAAIFPLAFWLPDSYPTAPAPVTAVFAGLLTKVGIYAILRSQTLIFASSDINQLLLIIAGLTLIIGILGAISQRDIKRVLSFTLISHIGYLLLGIAIATPAGLGAAVYYIVHHIIVQTAMFLVIGMLETHSGSTSLDKLGSLSTKAPLLALLAFCTMLNLGGIPPFSGFIGKIGLFSAAIETGDTLEHWLVGVGSLVSLLTLYVLLRVWAVAFWRPKKQSKENTAATDILERLVVAPNSTPERSGAKVPRLMTLATVAMVGVSLLLTLAAAPLIKYATAAGQNLADPQTQIAWYLSEKPEEKP